MKKDFWRLLIFVLICVICIMSWPEPAQAEDEVDIVITIGSRHFPSDDDYCETNPGIGATFHDSFTILAYKNSECDSGLLGVWTNRWDDNFSYSFGAAFGYDYAPLVPVFMVNYSVGENIFFSFVPGRLFEPIEEDSVNILILGLQF